MVKITLLFIRLNEFFIIFFSSYTSTSNYSMDDSLQEGIRLHKFEELSDKLTIVVEHTIILYGNYFSSRRKPY